MPDLACFLDMTIVMTNIHAYANSTCVKRRLIKQPRDHYNCCCENDKVPRIVLIYKVNQPNKSTVKARQLLTEGLVSIVAGTATSR